MTRVLLRAAVAAAVLLPGAVLGFSAPSQAAGVDSSAVTRTKTVERTNLAGGQEQVVDSRTVKVTVSQTTNLRSRQEVDVSWTGAHPSGGRYPDVNASSAKDTEYPVVVLECRGVDSASVARSKQLGRDTCWTASAVERYQSSGNVYPLWRADRYAAPADRDYTVNQPKHLPADCFPEDIAYWQPFTSVKGAVYPGGPGGCGGMAPESANVGGSSLPSNTTYGITEKDGTGTAAFDIWTDQDNASLGCSATVACSLVVIPIMGISCDLDAAGLPAADRPEAADVTKGANECKRKGDYAPGSIGSTQAKGDPAVSGAMWWAESNWRNRITVPLKFAIAPEACDVISNASGIDVYGSELLTQATAQWAPHFCLDPKLFRFKHIEVGEPEARHLAAAGGVDAAFLARPAGKDTARPIANAPTAVTGFAIGYTVDDEQGRSYGNLKLTPRLLAKLLTESYPGDPTVKLEYTKLTDNPLDISKDPEFRALNPGIADGVPANQAASTLLSLSSDSDIVHAITSYIDADPDARAWINGAPDPWGMKVNEKYKGIALPTESWPLLDTFKSERLATNSPCLGSGNNVPYLPLIAAPMSRLRNITQALQFSLSNPTTQCAVLDSADSVGKLVPIGRQPVGFRFMLGVTSYAGAQRYGIDTAALLSHTDPGAATKFTSAAGRTFTAPSTATLKAAVRSLTKQKSTGTWPIDYAKLRTSVPNGYPGTMIVYTAATTEGLPKSDARSLAKFLRYAVGDGQKVGYDIGDLPPGYLPITKGNGLAALVAQTKLVADQVTDQNGGKPVEPAPAATAAAPAAPDAAPAPVAPVPAPAATTAAPTADAGSATALVALGSTLGLGSGVAALVLPLVLLLAVGAGLVAAATYGLTRYRFHRSWGGRA